jgi:adenylosuccinate synthase
LQSHPYLIYFPIDEGGLEVTVVTVVGAQWGDEGKGKIIDLLAERADYVVRFSGGNNAGHTVVNSYGQFRLHLIPAGIFSTRATCIIGNGVAVDPAALLEEMDLLREKGVDLSRLYLSDRAHVIMPYHTLQDSLEEKARGTGALGTTKRGIGPAFADKAARAGLRLGDMVREESLRSRLAPILELKNSLLTQVYGHPALALEELLAEYAGYGRRLAPYVRDTTHLLQEAVEQGATVLLEGAQGTMLDPDFGTYPYVTASPCTAGGASLGSGIGPTRINRVLGVFKAYATRVGQGPLPSEMVHETGEVIRERGQEYGATTGRPRRCGWFDAVAARFAARINGFDGALITRLDVLDTLPLLKICTSYQVDGAELHSPPGDIELLRRCQPVYEEWPGWQSQTTSIREFEDLPRQAQDYVNRISQLIGCPIHLVSVGPRREETIEIRPVF